MFLKYALTFFLFTLINQKEFIKIYDTNDNLKSEGWLQNDAKTDFWTFYYANGEIEKKGHFNNDNKTGYWYFYTKNNTLIKEGHFINNKATNWWIFYKNDTKTKIQYKNGKKHGYALIYQNNRLIKTT
ncbi:toxin-antitoxin system YwqK family antitoxin, partial [Polaribacter sp.]|uniref:toxin-antitoxin system YwqK family antitoxin n=1 Tax=Polaribacter sp. TaxID=1920175 RepID=UPI003F6AE0E2